MARVAPVQLQLLQGGLALSAIDSVIEKRILNLVKPGQCLANRNALRRSVQILGRWISVSGVTRVWGGWAFSDRMANILPTECSLPFRYLALSYTEYFCRFAYFPPCFSPVGKFVPGGLYLRF